MKRSFLMLAHKYDPKKHKVKGFYVSEKLDGMRAFWDGGITRGMKASLVPFANVEKDGRYVNEIISTGLWSRYGKTIQAPNWFLDALPKVALDGELYYVEHLADSGCNIDIMANMWPGREPVIEANFPMDERVVPVGNFQKLVSTTKQLRAVDADWRHVQYRVFDSPAQHIIYGNGEINEINFKKTFLEIERALGLGMSFEPVKVFSDTYNYLLGLRENDVLKIHKQLRLSSEGDLSELLEEVTSKGGEGLMLRDGNSIWVPQRSHSLLKMKGLQDAEGTVIDYTWGRETDKGSKLLGAMGAMILRMDNGVVFELSGFTDAEREMTTPIYGSPGQKVSSEIENKMFPRGSRVTFRFRELSRDSVPKEARYYRKRDE